MKKITLINRDTIFYQFDPVIGFWGIPNIERTVDYRIDGKNHIRYFVKHNQDGCRDRNHQNRTKNCIICIGGSNTWGSGVEQNVRFTDNLQQMQPSDIVNLGHNSLGLDQICLTLLTKTEKYAPRTIIVEQYPWVLHRVLNRYVEGYLKPYFYFNNNTIQLSKVPYFARYPWFRQVVGIYRSYSKELREYTGGIDLNEMYDPKYDPMFLLWKKNYYNVLYQLVSSILTIIKEFCASKGWRLVFLILPIEQQYHQKSYSPLVDYALPYRQLLSSLQNQNIAVIDATKILLQKHKKRSMILLDGHLNADGHLEVARLIDRFLKKQ